MAFTIPNESECSFADMAGPDARDFDILAAGMARDGVIEAIGGECLVQSLASPIQAVQVTSGTIQFKQFRVAVSAMSSLGLAVANGSLGRFDLVVANNVGSLSVASGTAAATPVFPSIPNSSVVLAAVYVAASWQSVNSYQVIDKRCILEPSEPSHVTFYSASSGFGSWTNMPSALTEFLGSTVNRIVADLQQFNEFRIGHCMQSSWGTTTAQLGVQYAPIATPTSWYGLDNNTGNAQSDVRVNCSSVDARVSSWGAITGSAQDTVLLRVMGHSGDGTMDPRFTQLYIQTR